MYFVEQYHKHKELIWMLAKTDFKLRYQGSVLGYLWAILKPLALFLMLNFVFSSIFNPRNLGGEYYSLQLLVALMMFMFFSEATSAGMNSLIQKSQLVSKIYLPRWAIILSSTIHSAMAFAVNLIVIVGFFVWYQFMPSVASILAFLFFSVILYVIIVSFSLLAAPLVLLVKDVGVVWELVLRLMFYAVPILYPLTLLPAAWHQYILLNPIAFVVHFTKETVINGHYADPWQYAIFLSSVVFFAVLSIWTYNKTIEKAVEKI